MSLQHHLSLSVYAGHGNGSGLGTIDEIHALRVRWLMIPSLLLVLLRIVHMYIAVAVGVAISVDA